MKIQGPLYTVVARTTTRSGVEVWSCYGLNEDRPNARNALLKIVAAAERADAKIEAKVIKVQPITEGLSS